MENNVVLITAVLSITLTLTIYVAIKSRIRVRELERKYAGILNVESELTRLREVQNGIDHDIESLRASYKDKKALFDKLVQEAAIYDEEIQLAELGFYKPHFDFDTSEDYKAQIELTKQAQKALINAEKAIYCTIEWSMDGSKAKGKTMTNRAIRLTARAFNNECDAAISNTRWNNITRMEQRIIKAFEAINKLNQSNSIFISAEYRDLKLKELRLAHEYAEKKYQEKEEQREIREQMREEAKLEQELEAARKEEEKYNKLLERAQKDAEKATGDKLDALKQQISELSQELQVAHEKAERAKSMAEQTKRGHVYVISNIGSFGENVYKIGMTRRLEPLDRVKELGDASVPFSFDVHAMIHTEDAPSLENHLHRAFEEFRLNLVNNRKEFFNVSLSQIEQEVLKIEPGAFFIETAEARDYRESQTLMLEKSNADSKSDSRMAYPDCI